MQYLSEWSLFGVEGCYEQRLAGVGYRQALPLYYIDSIRDHAQQQICNALIQKIDLIYVEDAPMCLC